MTPIIVGWYLPVLVLAMRDPLIRDLVWDAAARGTSLAVRGLSEAALRAFAALLAQRRRLTCRARDDDWVVILHENDQGIL